MHIALLSGGDGWHVRDLQRAASEWGHRTTSVDFRRISSMAGLNGVEAPPYDAVIVRTMPPGSLEQVVFRMDVLHVWQANGIAILNPPRALEVCVDKYLCTARLEAAGLRVPATIVCQNADTAFTAFDRLGGDVVVKPIFGSEGRGMIRVSDKELAWRTFRSIERTQSVLYLQKFIAHPGWDVRAFVSRGRVLTSMRRIAKDDWRTNVAQGASAEPWPLPAELESLALQATEAVGATIAGVDLLQESGGEWYVIEVNAVPGWKALAPVTGIDVAREIIAAAAGRNA
jgi:ribosomal protein S6--L-glutamate ligase